MKYFLKPRALRNLKKFPRDTQKRILDKLDFYVRTDNPLAFAERLAVRHYGDWKFVIGDYRVLFDVSGDTLVILKIGHRRDIYK